MFVSIVIIRQDNNEVLKKMEGLHIGDAVAVWPRFLGDHSIDTWR